MILNKEIRKRIITKGAELGFGHYCSAMSCVDVVAYLYKKILTKDDIFIMGKGHGIIAVLPILEKKYPNIKWKPYLDYEPQMGIEATTASLGHGLPIAIGRAYARKLLNKKGNIYCMVGDGELQEGSNWEALNIAHKLKLNNLIVLVDWNKYQAVDSIKKIMDSDGKEMKRKFEAFGCSVKICNGHSNKSMQVMKKLKKGIVNVFILDTIKGKGIRFLEDNPSYHVVYWHEHEKEFKEALKDLE